MFGPFAPVFENVDSGIPGYLALLHLSSSGVQVAIDRIAVALRGPDAEHWFAALLQEVNWRPHLVGAIAVLLEPKLDCRLLWGAIDRGSWVIPQLVITAAFVDPMFRKRARERVDVPGPIGSDGHAARHAKMLASVVTMSAELPDLAEWRAGILEDERIKAILALDASSNDAGKIVTRWLAALRAAFLARGRTLEYPEER